MSSWGKRLQMIPRPAWYFGILLSVLLVLPLWFGPMRIENDLRTLAPPLKVALVAVVPVLTIGYSLLVGFIYADAKRRRMRHVMWAWLALVPYFVGVILYFILRDPLPTPCPRCGADVPRAFAFCPACGASVHPTCSQCGKPLQNEWMNCPHCGVPVPRSAAASESNP